MDGANVSYSFLASNSSVYFLKIRLDWVNRESLQSTPRRLKAKNIRTLN
jgi:hypothetical protein